MSGTPVRVRRTAPHEFTATNDRGARVHIGRDGAPEAFTPGELLLAAIASCSAVTSENLLSRRIGEDAELTVHADRDKDADDEHKFSSVHVDFDVDLAAAGDPEQRRKLVEAAERAIDRFCTVSRSVQEGTPIEVTLPE